MRIRTLPILALALAGLAAKPALAADAPLPELTDAVPGHPGVTIEDLLKQAAPDLHDQGNDVVGHVREPLRHLAGKDYAGDLDDPQVFTMPEMKTFEAGGRRYLAVMVDIGGMEAMVAGATLLALYDDAPKPRLLDMVNVGVDKDTSFDDPVIRLGPHDQALVTYSEHFNSDETYAGRLIAFVRGGRWRLLDNIGTYSLHTCGYERDETPVFTSRPDPGRAYWQVRVDMQVKTTRDPTEDCGDQKMPRPGLLHYRAVYRWDATRGRFVDTVNGLKALDRIDTRLNGG